MIRPEYETALRRYVTHHEHPGPFLRACLEGNWRLAIAIADKDATVAELKAIASWIYWEAAPSRCHGDVERVTAWLENREAA